MSNEWIEVPKPVTGARVKRDAVRFGVRKSKLATAHGAAHMAIAIGADILAKLKWGAATKLRMRWASDGSRMRIDEAPAGHPHVYQLTISAKHGHGRFFSSAMPSTWIGDEIEPSVVPVEVVIDRPGQSKALDSIILTLPRDFWFVAPEAKAK